MVGATRAAIGRGSLLGPRPNGAAGHGIGVVGAEDPAPGREHLAVEQFAFTRGPLKPAKPANPAQRA